MKLYDFQTECVEEILTGFSKQRIQCLSWYTGAGVEWKERFAGAEYWIKKNGRNDLKEKYLPKSKTTKNGRMRRLIRN